MTQRAIASSLSLLLCLVLVLTVLSSMQWLVDDHSNRGIVPNALLRNSTTNVTAPPAAAKHKRAKIYYREGTAYDRRQLKTSHDRDLSTTSYFEPQISTAIMPDEVNQLGTGNGEVFTIQHTIDGATASISDGQLGDECQANVAVEDWTPPPPPSVHTSTFYLWPPTQELFAIQNVSSLHGDSIDNCSGENITTSFMGCSTTDHQGTLPIDCFFDASTDTLFVRAEQLTVSRRYLRGRRKSSKDAKSSKASEASSKKKSQKMSKASASDEARQRNPPPPIRPRIEPTHTYHVRLDLADEAGNIRPTTFIVHAPHSDQEVQNLGLGGYQRLDTASGDVVPALEGRNRRRRHNFRTQANN